MEYNYFGKMTWVQFPPMFTNTYMTLFWALWI